ncbi:hypothetical protein FXO38_01349 [Capsicum annuum]|nr:hypothetical protein FXO38_01349 [Capsicum annuum]
MTNLENQDHSHAKDEITALNNQSPTSDPPRKDVSTTPSSKINKPSLSQDGQSITTSSPAESETISSNTSIHACYNESLSSYSFKSDSKPTDLCYPASVSQPPTFDLDRTSDSRTCTPFFDGYPRSGDSCHYPKSQLLSPTDFVRDEKSNRVICESNVAVKRYGPINAVHGSAVYSYPPVSVEPSTYVEPIPKNKQNSSNVIFHTPRNSQCKSIVLFFESNSGPAGSICEPSCTRTSGTWRNRSNFGEDEFLHGNLKFQKCFSNDLFERRGQEVYSSPSDNTSEKFLRPSTYNK